MAKNFRKPKNLANQTPSPSLKSWDDVDQCLREIAEYELALIGIETKENAAILEITQKVAKQKEPVQSKIVALSALVQTFVEENRADIKGKTKTLNFGKVGFRKSGGIDILSERTEEVIENLRRYGMDNCIITKESVSKKMLDSYSDEEIQKVGASREVREKFWMETNMKKSKG
ncbi:MAG: host-nuclease inhibitor Gam family protein [Defluviitaleaceae bacterium]|nr:host-nuclease inhibitor Gam family protein [Defluviitaleaceae bacterium]